MAQQPLAEASPTPAGKGKTAAWPPAAVAGRAGGDLGACLVRRRDADDAHTFAEVDTAVPSSDSEAGGCAGGLELDGLPTTPRLPLLLGSGACPFALSMSTCRSDKDSEGDAPDALGPCAAALDRTQPCWLALRGPRLVVAQPGRRPPAEDVQLPASYLESSADLPTQQPSTLAGVHVVAVPNTHTTRIAWVLDAKKLFSKDRCFVSPAFELPLGCQVPFKVLLQAKKKSQARGGENFCRARGIGSVHLKCEAASEEVPPCAALTFTIAVGKEPPRGPVRHDFSHGSVAGLPPDGLKPQYWNLRSSVDDPSQSLTIYLEVECAHTAVA